MQKLWDKGAQTTRAAVRQENKACICLPCHDFRAYVYTIKLHGAFVNGSIDAIGKAPKQKNASVKPKMAQTQLANSEPQSPIEATVHAECPKVVIL